MQAAAAAATPKARLRGMATGAGRAAGTLGAKSNRDSDTTGMYVRIYRFRILK